MKKIFFIIVSIIITMLFTSVAFAEEAVSHDDSQKSDGSELEIDESLEIMGTDYYGPVVICIDPGHGGDDPGSILYSGGYEKDVTLKIALYLKDALEEYSNVKVVMTRSTDTSLVLADRAQIAASAGAHLLISIHTDAYSGSSRGISVFYPNNHYKPALSETGKAVAVNVANELNAIGLSTGSGVTTRSIDAYDSDLDTSSGLSNYTYPATQADYNLGTTVYTSDSGYKYTLGDYYSVIRNSKKRGVAAIIVEHGFGDNKDDYTQFLSTDAKLKNLAAADARALVSYFNLVKYEIKQLSDGNWYCVSGEDIIDITGTVKGTVNNESGHWYVKNGKIRLDYTGLARNNNGWWRIENGKVNFNYNGITKNEYGWWYVKNGQVIFSYTGFADNEYGRWRIEGGKVNFSYSNVAKDNGEWRYYSGGKWQSSSTTVAKNEYGWWYVKNGVVDFSFTGLAKNKYGWWRIENGKVNFKFTGITQNAYGWWYVKSGKVDFSFSGTYNGYTVKNGKVSK